MADRLISWLEDCGYVIVEKAAEHPDASLVPAAPDKERSFEGSQ
ncbi:conserved hypothetical protein [Bradyrhizobium sp. STM 3809]|nr:conserved hypothetical protein [Bradyrhizobium sp. STM 3809]